MMPTGWTYVLLSPFLAALVVIDERAAVLVVCWVAIGLLQILLARANFAGLRLSMELETPRTRVGRGGTRSSSFNPEPAMGSFPRPLYPASACRGMERAMGGVRWSDHPSATHATVEAMVTPLRFGRLFINVAEVSSTYPFGLYGLTAEWLPPPTAYPHCLAAPASPPVPKTNTRGRAPRDIAGTQVLPGIDVRPYREGDPLATVCWKSSARTGRLHVRPREIDAHRPRVLVVSSLRSDWASLEQFWRMVTVACAILEEGYRRKTLSALQLDNRNMHPRDAEPVLSRRWMRSPLFNLEKPAPWSRPRENPP